MSDSLRIDGLELQCVIGIYPHERERPQPLIVDLELVLDTRLAATTGALEQSVHYALVASEAFFVLTHGQFGLLETAAHALARWILLPPAPGEARSAVDAVQVRLTKPEALGGRARPSLSIRRTAGEMRYEREEKSWGWVDIVHESERAGIYRLNIAPGGGIPLHVHRAMREAEMVLSDGLLCQGRATAVGSTFRWPLDAPHGYDNPSERHQSLLCIDRPRFDPADEIVVQGEPARIDPEPPWIALGGAG